MRSEEFVKAELARLAWADGKNEGLSGIKAVAFTIRNRQRAGFYGGSWVQILSHHLDYSSTNKPLTNVLPDPNDYTFSLLLQEIDGIFSGITEDDITQSSPTTMGPIVTFDTYQPKPVALYYGYLNDPDIKESFLENITRNHERHKLIATVGLLSFFS